MYIIRYSKTKKIMDINRYSWILADIHGYSWIPIDIHGY